MLTPFLRKSMKKRIVFALSVLMVAPALYARDCAEQLSGSEERIIQYTITMYRDSEKYDADRWEDMKQDAHRAIARGRQEVRGDVLQAVTDAIQNISTDGEGIQGEISVSISDGACSDRCGDKCSCTKRYGGLCPCPKNEGESTKSCCENNMTECKAVCEKSECDKDADCMKTCKEACAHEARCEDGGACKKSCEKEATAD